MTSQTSRVLELLKRFNNNQKVCIETLKDDYLWEGKSEKTIRRDLNIIKQIFPDSFHLIRGEKGCYKAITKEVFENFLKPNNLSLIVQTFTIAQRSNLFNRLNMDKSDKAIIKHKIESLKKIYAFKSKPFECKIGEYELFKILENSIYHSKYLTIEYLVNDEVITIETKPYKIIFLHENFYLACDVDNQEEYRVSLFRLIKIKLATLQSRVFYKEREIEQFIEEIQTPFSFYQKNYKEHLIDIILEVDSQKAFYFESKKFLQSQKLLGKTKERNLRVGYRVTKIEEVDELIKRWLPYIKVIEPLILKQKIEGELREYLGIDS